jgi:hypothetical protein
VTARRDEPAPLPAHWTPEQALAVFECLHALREQLWSMYGPAVQQAWCAQLAPQLPLPEFDPNDQRRVLQCTRAPCGAFVAWCSRRCHQTRVLAAE